MSETDGQLLRRALASLPPANEHYELDHEADGCLYCERQAEEAE